MASSALALPLPFHEHGSCEDRQGREDVFGETPGHGSRASGTPLRLAIERGPGGPTLDTLMTRLWEGLVADREVSCPWCSGAMAPGRVAGGRRPAGRCSDCGSILA